MVTDRAVEALTWRGSDCHKRPMDSRSVSSCQSSRPIALEEKNLFKGWMAVHTAGPRRDGRGQGVTKVQQGQHKADTGSLFRLCGRQSLLWHDAAMIRCARTAWPAHRWRDKRLVGPVLVNVPVANIQTGGRPALRALQPPRASTPRPKKVGGPAHTPGRVVTRGTTTPQTWRAEGVGNTAPLALLPSRSAQSRQL